METQTAKAILENILGVPIKFAPPPVDSYVIKHTDLEAVEARLKMLELVITEVYSHITKYADRRIWEYQKILRDKGKVVN